MRGPPFGRPPQRYSQLKAQRRDCSRGRLPPQVQLPEVQRRLKALHEALVIWTLDPYEPAPQPRFFCLHLPDFTPEQLEEWRRNR